MPDARVTATNLSETSPGLRVSKVLYRSSTQADATDEDVESVQVDADAYDALLDLLRTNHVLMGSEVINGLAATFLPRYERNGSHYT